MGAKKKGGKKGEAGAPAADAGGAAPGGGADESKAAKPEESKADAGKSEADVKDGKSEADETSSYYFHVQSVAKWLSCNGEPAGVGPTLVVASAAAVFLYHELRQSVRGGGGAGARLEKLLLSTMAVGALALLVHVWVCAARFFLYYLDTLLRESPCLLLELTTAGVLGARSEALLTPLTRFAREQQHQIHVTACWFLALCCADYVRKHYCETFNLPYLEQWQSGLQRRTSRSVRAAAKHAGSFVAGLQRRLN
ncbi:unnamed protein product [Plutella xylostella]|uniref:(diamondback moth) hypothetical protein n=1 Tax=Plutella xylostella TaxID=51655 RepID=A0A8S4FBZ4_PLUXY|nr:unnamed protein product [Plutella xylostella]